MEAPKCRLPRRTTINPALNLSHMLHGAGIFREIFPKNGQNVGNYSIHGAYGYSYLCQLNLGPAPSISIPKRCNPGWIGILGMN